MRALTNESPAPSQNSVQASALESHKANLQASAAKYFALLSSIDVQLRRQVYALEEAEIISAETSNITKAGSALPAALAKMTGEAASAPSSQNTSDKTTSAAGGLGNLDIGWLNSRSDAVGKEMEAEIWEKAEALLQKMHRPTVEALGASHDTDGEAMNFEHSQS